MSKSSTYKTLKLHSLIKTDEKSLTKPVAVYTSIPYSYQEYSHDFLKISSVRIKIGAYLASVEKKSGFEIFQWLLN